MMFYRILDQMTSLSFMYAIAFYLIGSISSHSIDLAFLEHSSRSARSIHLTTFINFSEIWIVILMWDYNKLCLKFCLLIFCTITAPVPGMYHESIMVELIEIKQPKQQSMERVHYSQDENVYEYPHHSGFKIKYVYILLKNYVTIIVHQIMYSFDAWPLISFWTSISNLVDNIDNYS